MDVRLVVVAGLLVVSSVSAADAAVACPCFADCGADPPYVQFGESCFRHHWAALGWTEARAACARDGGVLAENVGYLVHADSRIDTWIGARAASSEPAELRWQSSGEPLVDGLPQNVTVHPSTFPEGGCAFILESHIYVWSECDDPLAFICERPVVDIVPAQLHLSAARAWGQTHGTGASTLSLGMVWTADGSEAYTSITASKSDGCISSCLRLVSVPEDLQGSQEYGVSIRFLSGSRAGVDVPANVTHRMVASPSVTGSPTLVVSASDYYSGGALQLTGAGFDFAWVKMVAESCSASGNPAKVGAGGAISFSSEDERLAPGSERLLCLAEGTTGPLSGWFSAGVVVEVRNMPQFEPELWAPSPGEVWGSAVPYSIVLQGLDLDQALEYYHCAWKETEPADCVTGCSPPQHSDAGIVSLEFDYARAPGKRQVCWQLHDQQPGEDGASTGVVVLVPNLNPFSASATTLTYSDALFAGAYFPLSNVGAGVEGLCGALVPATAVSGGFAGRNCAEIEIFSEPASGLLPAPLSTASAGAEHVLLLSYNGQTARFFATDNRVTWDAAPSFDASGTVMPLSLGDLSSGVLNLTLTARHLTPGFTIGQNPFESFQWDILSLRVAAIFEQPPEVRITSTDSDSLEEKLQRIFRLACLGAAGVCVVMVLGLGVTRMRGYRQLQDQRRSPKRLSSVASDNGARSDRTTALGESSGECKRTKAVPIPPGLERFNPPEAADSRSPAALRGANAVVRSPVFSPRMPVSAPPFTQPLQPVISASSCHHSSAPTSRANSLQQLAPLSVPSHGFPPLPAIPATMESI
ncbi:hypothetical protein DIPPA_12954 [Diplonema papillatum]|nr:hypothetical protein DIPPA_12954 [Diplonema papillatum]